MKLKKLLKGLSLLLLTIIVISTGSVQAVETTQTPDFYPNPQYEPGFSNDNITNIEYEKLLQMAGDNRGREGSILQSSGGPDDFGYTWEKLTEYDWIDLSDGIETGISNTVPMSDWIDIGFDFPYYENAYNQLYISRHGYISFDASMVDRTQSRIPDPSQPNDVIAPHWISSDGINFVKYLTGGVQPERWFAIEWFQQSSSIYQPGFNHESILTFQLILYEDGSIQFVYDEMLYDPAMWYCQSSGIEDQFGLDGLSITDFCNRVESHHSVIINRPPPQRRLRLELSSAGQFSSVGQAEDFLITVSNIGQLGEDIFEFNTNSNWPILLYFEDGVTPLTEPISVDQGDSVNLIARVTAPVWAEMGDSNNATITATSISDPTKSRTVSLASAIPAPFAMVMQDFGNDGGIISYLIRPEAQDQHFLNGWAGGMAVLELPNRNQIYAWDEWRCLEWVEDNGYSYCDRGVREIYYAIRDRFGAELLPPTKLQDLSNVQNDPADHSVALAAAPNGNIALIWVRQRARIESGVWKLNSNIHFAVLNQSGEVVTSPFGLTNDQSFYNWSEVNYRWRYNPQVAATEDGRFPFVFGLGRRTSQTGHIYNVSFGIRGNQGQNLTSITWLTNSVEGSSRFLDPTITHAGGNNALIGWSREDLVMGDGWGFYEISAEYTVINSSNTVVKPVTNFSSWLWRPTATRLSDGNILFAGSQWDGISYYLIDGNNYDLISMHNFLPDAEGFEGYKNISVTGTQDGQVILTWMCSPRFWDGIISNHLFYALLNNDGSVVTPSMPFYSGVQPEWDGQPDVRTGQNGQGHTTYTYSYPPYFTSEPLLSVIESELYTYDITADDPDFPEENLAITAQTKPDWLTLTDNGDGTATLAGMPDVLDVGEHEVVLQVTDLFSLTDVQTFTVTVLSREAPSIISDNETTFAVGLAGDFTIMATGVPTPEISFSGDLPPGVSFIDNGDGTATLSGTPAAGSGGNYPLTITASNGMQPNATQNFSLTVGEAPEIISASTAEFTVGVDGSFTVTTTGEPMPTITYEGKWPSEVTLVDNNDGTASLSGTPSEGTGGYYQVEISADNGSGYIATQLFTLIVTTEEEIGSDGGVILSNNDEIRVIVPPGSVVDGTKFIFSPQVVPAQPIPGNLNFANTSFQLTTEGPPLETPFNPPLDVRIEYDPVLLDEMPADTLILYYWSGTQWNDAICDGDSYSYTRGDPEMGEYWFELPICHLTEFAVMGQGGFMIYLPLIVH